MFSQSNNLIEVSLIALILGFFFLVLFCFVFSLWPFFCLYEAIKTHYITVIRNKKIVWTHKADVTQSLLRHFMEKYNFFEKKIIKTAKFYMFISVVCRRHSGQDQEKVHEAYEWCCNASNRYASRADVCQNFLSRRPVCTSDDFIASGAGTVQNVHVCIQYHACVRGVK